MARKRYQGPKNDKQRTMAKLINAVGTIIATKGYTGLTATNIANVAGLSRRTITLHFDTVENLIETYVKGKDYWVAAAGDAPKLAEINRDKNSKEILEALLLNQFRYLYENEEMQKIVLWQISERTDIMSHVIAERENLSEAFFKLSDQEFKKTDIDLRAVSSLLVAGIYFLVLHAKSTDVHFCEIDLNSETGFKRVEKAICYILDTVYADIENHTIVN